MRSKELTIDIDTMSVMVPVQSNKVIIVVVDGNVGKAKMLNAVDHGFTIVETAKGKAARIRFEESELF